MKYKCDECKDSGYVESDPTDDYHYSKQCPNCNPRWGTNKSGNKKIVRALQELLKGREEDNSYHKPKIECECGAKHTSSPNIHALWCPCKEVK